MQMSNMAQEYSLTWVIRSWSECRRRHRRVGVYSAEDVMSIFRTSDVALIIALSAQWPSLYIKMI